LESKKINSLTLISVFIYVFIISSLKISVITLTYNALDYLKKTFSSVISQDYENLEYIVVDGNSSDGSKQWLEECSCLLNGRIIFSYISEDDKGIYDAMNKGIQRFSGDYCIFLNSGDTFVDPQVVSRVTQAITIHNMPDVVYGNIIKQGKVVVAGEARNFHRMYYCHQAAFISRQCLLEYPFDTKYHLSADFKQSKQLLSSGKRFFHVNQIISEYDTTGISNKNRSKGLKENIHIILELDDFKSRLRLIPHLLLPYIISTLRGK